MLTGKSLYVGDIPNKTVPCARIALPNELSMENVRIHVRFH